MAEGFLRELSREAYEAYSAGTWPTKLNPLAVRAMAEVGIDIASQESKGIGCLVGIGFDAAVTVCDHARDTCPVFPGADRQLHWSFDDPADALGNEEERMAVFRRVRDEIRSRIEGSFGQEFLRT